MHELRYFQEIHAVAPDVHTLWLLKCRYILLDLFQEPSALKIYFDGENEWIFDYLPTKREASEIVNEASLSRWDFVRYGCGNHY